TDYLEIIKFEKQLRQPRRAQPNKLDTLLATADGLLTRAIPAQPSLRAAVPAPGPGADGVQDGRINVGPGAPAPPVRPGDRPPLPPLALRLPGEPRILPTSPAPEARPAAPGGVAGGPIPTLPAPPDTTAAAPPAGLPSPALPARPPGGETAVARA